jgi:hypothetical protein
MSGSRRWLSDNQIRALKLGDCSKSSLHRYRKNPRFPRPRRYGGRNITPEEEIDAHLAEVFNDPPRDDEAGP